MLSQQNKIEKASARQTENCHYRYLHRQDAGSSTIYGMPQEAFKNHVILPLNMIVSQRVKRPFKGRPRSLN